MVEIKGSFHNNLRKFWNSKNFFYKGVYLFQGGTFILFVNFPEGTFIKGATLIPDLRVCSKISHSNISKRGFHCYTIFKMLHNFKTYYFGKDVKFIMKVCISK